MFSLFFICIFANKKNNEMNEKTKCDIINFYTNKNFSIEKLCKEFHVGKSKIYEILLSNNVKIRKRGGITTHNKIFDFHDKKYKNTNEYKYVAISNIDGTEFFDCENSGGHITSYLRKVVGISIPSLYERRTYYMEHGKYWWEQWFTVKKININEFKKCPLCEWKTIDIHNKSGAFEKHLLKVHNLTKEEYISKFPIEKSYFKTANKQKQLQMESDITKYVKCEICGKKLKIINNKHLAKHGITKFDYVKKYCNVKTITNDLYDFFSENMKKMNSELIKSKTSKAENEIRKFIIDLGFSCESNREILNGKEIDLYIPSVKLGIEYNGLLWHTETFGKKGRKYHIEKTEQCKNKGINLIHIFEDEYINNKEIVLSKISHLLKCDNYNKKISGRKCIINEIEKDDAKKFLDKFHIQGFSKSTLYLGCFFNNELIGVMTFLKNGNDSYTLSRFATNINYTCRGVGGKLFKYFISKYNPHKVISFADRRWTINEKENLYTKLGFKFEYYTKPDYRYYNPHIEKYKRIHKFNFRKKELNRKYGLDMNLTENEMAKILGYDKIWDCGLIKYVFENELYL